MEASTEKVEKVSDNVGARSVNTYTKQIVQSATADW